MIKTYTYKVKPNTKVEHKFVQWCGICRFVYNCSKDLNEQNYQKGIKLSKFDIQKQLTEAKKYFTWVKEVHSHTLQAVTERLDNSFKKFFNGAGYPRWASKKRWKSIPFKSIKTTHNAFKLPSFGIIKVFKFKQPKGILKTAILIQEADGLYLKVVIQQEDKPNSDNQTICAIDMGITHFLTTSDGEFIENPKHLFSYLKQLRIENRKLSRMKKGGSNFKKQVNVLALLHQKIHRTRKDFLHKQSRLLANKYQTVIRENLNITGMSKNSRLSKHILDCSWGIFFDLLEYKTNVIKVNSKYSSQECSACGHICKENRKTQSLFECINCGYSENADIQATFNLMQRGQTLLGANVNQ